MGWEELDNNNEYFLILDGLNEIGDKTEQEAVFGKIAIFSIDNKNFTILLTTQFIYPALKEFGDFYRYEVQNIDKIEIINYLVEHKQIFNSYEDAEQFYINLPNQILFFISIPIFLKAIISIYEESGKINVINPGQIYMEYERLLFKPRDYKPGINDIYYNKFVPFLAFMKHTYNIKTLSREDFNLLVNEFNEKFAYTLNSEKIYYLLIDRILVSEEGMLKYYHESLEDFYVAKYLLVENIDVTKYFDSLYSPMKYYLGLISPLKALEIFSKCHNFFMLFGWSSITDVIDIVKNITYDIIYWETEVNPSDCIGTCYKVLSLLENENEQCGKLYCIYLFTIALAFEKEGCYQKAQFYFEKGYNIIVLLDNDELLIYYLYELSNLYFFYIKDNKKALKFLKKARIVFNRFHARNDIVFGVYLLLGHYYLKHSKLSYADRYYMEIVNYILKEQKSSDYFPIWGLFDIINNLFYYKQYKYALKYLNILLSVYSCDVAFLCQIYQKFGECYLKIGKKKKARVFFIKAIISKIRHQLKKYNF